MDKLHVLMICPNADNPLMLKQAGTLALALKHAGMTISLLWEGITQSPFDQIPDIQNFYAPKRHRFSHYFRSPLQQTFKRCLEGDKTIDVVFLTNFIWPATELAPIAARLDVPLLTQLQRIQNLPHENSHPWVRYRQHKLLPLFKPMIVGSHALLDAAKKAGVDELVYIPPGVNTEHFKPVLSKRPIRRNLGLPEKTTLVCSLATIEPSNKQLEALKKCMPLSETRHVLLIGKADKTYLEHIQTWARENGVDKFVHVLEAVDNPEDYLKASDLFILLGGIEDRHTTILEAQSAGLPVVLAPSPSALVLTNGNRCGVVLYPNNPLADKAFQKLLADASYRQGRALNTRPYVKKEFGFGRMMDAYIKLLNSL